MQPTDTPAGRRKLCWASQWEYKDLPRSEGPGGYRRGIAFQGRKGRDLLFVSSLINCTRSIYLHDLIEFSANEVLFLFVQMQSRGSRP